MSDHLCPLPKTLPQWTPSAPKIKPRLFTMASKVGHVLVPAHLSDLTSSHFPLPDSCLQPAPQIRQTFCVSCSLSLACAPCPSPFGLTRLIPPVQVSTHTSPSSQRRCPRPLYLTRSQLLVSFRTSSLFHILSFYLCIMTLLSAISISQTN